MQMKKEGAALLLLPAAMLFHTQVQAAILTAGERCVRVLVPSLYVYTILAAFCTRAGLFGGRGGMAGAVLFSQLGGYPVGAQLVEGMYRTGTLTRAEAQRLLCVCFGCGPGFVLGTVCGRMPLSYGLWMLLSVSLPNLVCGAVLLCGIHPAAEQTQRMRGVELMTASVEAAGNAMLRICGMVLAMAALTGIAEGAGLFRLTDAKMAAFLRTLLEVSCITDWSREGGSLPMAAALLSFGGICVHMQVAAISGGLLPWVRFWGMRLLCSAAAYGLCAAGLCFLPDVQPAAVLSQEPVPALTEGSLLPGACLLMMTLLLLHREQAKK